MLGFVLLTTSLNWQPLVSLNLSSTPDTVRLDWLDDPENTIGKVMLPGWCSDEYDSLRDAIDAAMRIQAMYGERSEQ